MTFILDRHQSASNEGWALIIHSDMCSKNSMKKKILFVPVCCLKSIWKPTFLYTLYKKNTTVEKHTGILLLDNRQKLLNLYVFFSHHVLLFFLRGDNLVLELDLLTSSVKVCMYHVTCSLVRSFHRRSPINVHSCFFFILFGFFEIFITLYDLHTWQCINFVHSFCWFVNMCQWTNSRVGWCIVQVWNIISWIFIILSYAHYNIWH